jgi:hypothetical protein
VRGAGLIALEVVDENAGLTNPEFVRGAKAVAFPQEIHEVYPSASTDGPDRFDLGCCGWSWAWSIWELGWRRVGAVRDPGTSDRGVGADFDDFLLSGLGIGAVSEPCDLILDGLLTRLIRTLDDDLEAFAVLKKRAVEFRFDMARG